MGIIIYNWNYIFGIIIFKYKCIIVVGGKDLMFLFFFFWGCFFVFRLWLLIVLEICNWVVIFIGIWVKVNIFWGWLLREKKENLSYI